MATKQTVAVLGAGGLMGFAMAGNLARDGYAIRAWNRSRGHQGAPAEQGKLVVLASGPDELRDQVQPAYLISAPASSD